MKRIYFLTLFAAAACTALSQGGGAGISNVQEMRKVPMPPSPNAAALGKFGDIPVSLSTGIPSISIPFFSYADETKGLSVSVSLSYHAGGHKLEDMPSNVGLGWALNAGGVISRVMRGRPDDDFAGYLNTGVLPYYNTTSFDYQSTFASAATPTGQGIGLSNAPSSDAYTAKGVAENQIDGECDLFQFSVADISGRFFFRKNGEIQLISQAPVKITYTRSNGNQGIITEFVITDGKGIRYIFNKTELIDAISSLGIEPGSSLPYISSWYIDRIISADGLDEVVFNYTAENPVFYEGGFSDALRVVYVPSPSGPLFWAAISTESHQYIGTQSKRLSSINFPDGSQAFFKYDLARLDYVGDKALTSVHIKSDNHEKKFVLGYDYFISPTCNSGSSCIPPISYSANDYYKRLKLVSVQESDGSVSLPPYSFEYNPTPMMHRNSKAQDWWGYYNGVGVNSTLVANIPIPGHPTGLNIPRGDRDPSEQHTKAWVLEKIYYPTGGNTKFTYELNDGFKGTVYRLIGGLRLKRTEHFDAATGQLLVSNYSYKKEDNSSSGTFQTLPNFTFYWTRRLITPKDNLTPEYHEEILNQTSSPTQSLSVFHGSPVIYTRVKVDKDQQSQSNGYSIHEFSAFPADFTDEYYPFIQKQDRIWSQALPTKEIHYNSSGVIVSSKENEYEYFHIAPEVSSSQDRNLLSGIRYWDDLGTPYQNLYSARAYCMAYGRAELKRIKERIYSPAGDYLEDITDYTYDPVYFLLTKKITTRSNAKSIETRLFYPFNYSSTGLASKTGLLNAHRVAELISQEVWELDGANHYLNMATVFNYGTFNGNLIKKSTVAALETAAPLGLSMVGSFNPDQLKRHAAFKDQSEFLSYDGKGRIREIRAKGGTTVCYIWGAGSRYPIAEIYNAGADMVAYSSFESQLDYGGWTIAAGAVYVNGGITGNKSLTGTLSKTVPSGNYLLTLWSKQTPTINGSMLSQPPSRILGDWKLFVVKLAGLTTVTLTGTEIDEVRLFPEAAQMATTTFDQLAGVTSKCDVDNRLSYFDYDGFGRLHLVKDEQKKIIKKICYNYNGQIETCSGVYSTAQWRPTGSMRCKACISNAFYISNIREREERDENPLSPTYNSYRWVDDGPSSSCIPQPDWQTISVTCQQSNGVNTGVSIVITQDKNPCSPTHGQTNTTQVNGGCPLPGCNTSNCSGPEKKCINGSCEIGVKVYTASVLNSNTGLYDCTYHYEWSDNSWSQDYTEQNAGACPLF
ncbi:MAG TPA: hypothetical protein VFR58_11010 [Flavisolibacter sp.]|nr:hypothetical protein [Flavisolibacter sp.]